MATTSIPSTLPEGLPPFAGAVPPLENGDRLTREEFERRYNAMTDLKKAELIEGVVHMPSPVRAEQHGEPHFALTGLLAFYCHFTPGVRGADNATVRLDLKNEPQPDDILFCDPRLGGRARIDTDGFICGAPELAAEISASSVSIDLGSKLVAYRRCGIQEYIVWRVLDRALDWFELIEKDYARLEPGPDGAYRSKVFPGLWLDAAAILAGDFPRAHAVLQQGLASAEHQRFVASLRQS